MDDYLDPIEDEVKAVFTLIANYAFALGFKVKKDATESLGYIFRHAKIKKTIMRFSTIHDKPIIRFKFYASATYSPYFHEAIRATIEEYNFRYTGCYNCGRCDGTQGYTYHYPDGRCYFRCGMELIELFDVKHIPVDEFLTLFKTQHDYFLVK